MRKEISKTIKKMLPFLGTLFLVISVLSFNYWCAYIKLTTILERTPTFIQVISWMIR